MKKIKRLDAWGEKLRRLDHGKKVTVKGKKKCLGFRINWHLNASLLRKEEEICITD